MRRCFDIRVITSFWHGVGSPLFTVVALFHTGELQRVGPYSDLPGPIRGTHSLPEVQVAVWQPDGIEFQAIQGKMYNTGNNGRRNTREPR